MEMILLKKRLNLIAMIIQTVSCGLLCIPGMYYDQFWEKKYAPLHYNGLYIGSTSHYELNKSESEYVSYLTKLGSLPDFFNVLALLVMIVVALLLYYKYFSVKKMQKFLPFLPVFEITQIILYLIASLKEDEYGGYENWKRDFEVAPLFYIEMILLVLVAFLSIYSILKKSDPIENDSKEKDIEELKEY